MQKTLTNPKEDSYDICELKIDMIAFEQLRRNDLIFFQNDIWRCQSINMRLFQSLETKKQMKIPNSNESVSINFYLRIEKLELIPKEWKHNQKNTENGSQLEPQIILKGQQLGLGPIHEVQVKGMRQFQELEVVKSEKLKGREIPFKVILCKTKKQNCYLIGGIDFLN